MPLLEILLPGGHYLDFNVSSGKVLSKSNVPLLYTVFTKITSCDGLVGSLVLLVLILICFYSDF